MPKNKQTSLQIRLLMLYSGAPNQIQKYESIKHINLIIERRQQSLDSLLVFLKIKFNKRCGINHRSGREQSRLYNLLQRQNTLFMSLYARYFAATLIAEGLKYKLATEPCVVTDHYFYSFHNEKILHPSLPECNQNIDFE